MATRVHEWKAPTAWLRVCCVLFACTLFLTFFFSVLLRSGAAKGHGGQGRKPGGKRGGFLRGDWFWINQTNKQTTMHTATRSNWALFRKEVVFYWMFMINCMYFPKHSAAPFFIIVNVRNWSDETWFPQVIFSKVSFLDSWQYFFFTRSFYQDVFFFTSRANSARWNGDLPRHLRVFLRTLIHAWVKKIKLIIIIKGKCSSRYFFHFNFFHWCWGRSTKLIAFRSRSWPCRISLFFFAS